MIFQHLTPAEHNVRQKLVAGCSQSLTRLKARRNASIYVPGDVAREIYLTERGKIQVGRISSGGRAMMTQLVRPGQLFGEAAALAGEVHVEEAKALEDTHYVSFPASRFHEQLATDPCFALAFAELLYRRLVEARERLADMAFQRIPQRLARLLLKEAQRGGRPHDGRVRIRLGLTHEQLARMIGTSREMVTASLNELRALRLIEYRRGSYNLFDEKLRVYLKRPGAY